MKTPPAPAKSPWPMRINKYLAHQGLATRRGADEIIAKGKVLVNGRVAVLGDKVRETDRVELAGTITPKKYLYYAYNKPLGVITHSPQLGEDDIKTRIMKGNAKSPMSGTPSSVPMRDVFPVGRLDKDSHGLIILTNDGRVTDRLLNPDYDHDKEYRVQTLSPLRESFKKYMEAGVDIEGYLTAPCKVRKTGANSFNVTLTEGKKHQIRRMVSALHNQVTDLERVRIMNIRLDGLKPNATRTIEGIDLATFLSSIGMK